MLSPKERTLRARIGALSLHAQGKTNTGPATAAFNAKFYAGIPDDLPPEERDRRAALARKAHMTKLSLARSRARTATDQAGTK